MALGVQAEVQGPIVDGRAKRAVREMTQAAVDEAALTLGVNVVQELMRVVKHPTPYYWTQIDVVQEGPVDVVTDHGIVYGPWLAGQGSRNFPVTRFRGYRHWQRARQALEREWPRVAVKILNKYIPKMNG
jgi:hypothetical protein